MSVMPPVRGALQGVPRSVLPLEKAPHSGSPQNPEGGQGLPCSNACLSAPGHYASGRALVTPSYEWSTAAHVATGESHTCSILDGPTPQQSLFLAGFWRDLATSALARADMVRISFTD